MDTEMEIEDEKKGDQPQRVEWWECGGGKLQDFKSTYA